MVICVLHILDTNEKTTKKSKSIFQTLETLYWGKKPEQVSYIWAVWPFTHTNILPGFELVWQLILQFSYSPTNSFEKKFVGGKSEKSRFSWEKVNLLVSFQCFSWISYLISNVEEEISFQSQLLNCLVFYIQ